MRLPGVDTHKRHAHFAKAVADRWRHAASLDNRTSKRSMSIEHISYRSRAAFNLFRRERSTLFVNDADLRAFHRQV